MFLENATKRSFTSLSLVDTSAKGFLSDDIGGLAKKPPRLLSPNSFTDGQAFSLQYIMELIIAVVGS